jgi:hypothetical protein
MVDGDPVPVFVSICIGVCYPPVAIAADGSFVWPEEKDDEYPCVYYDFDSYPLIVDLIPDDDGGGGSWAAYAFARHPTQAAISDEGDDDFELDVGSLTLYKVDSQCSAPSPGAVTPICGYVPDIGATVDEAGVAFELPPESLVKAGSDGDIPITHDQSIAVFEAPLDDWAPPFMNDDIADGIAALYFISPRWAKIAGDGVPLSIALPDGWSAGDTGTLYLLGGYVSRWGDAAEKDMPAFIYRNAEGNCVNDDGSDDLEAVGEGELTPCGEVTVRDGRLVTPPIPRFTWVGIGR